jgi:hypothetical protein
MMQIWGVQLFCVLLSLTAHGKEPLWCGSLHEVAK